MPRVYKKKGTRIEFSEADMQKAVEDVLEYKLSYRTAAERNNVKHTALFYRLKNRHLSKDYSIKYNTNQIFSTAEESELQNYLLKSSRINYGLTYESTRKLAYEYALRLNKKIPESWRRDSKAGVEWMKSFMKRHQQLSLRKPENTSLSRATSFNKANVSAFFENFIKVMERFKFKEERIFNLDETGIMTVVQAPYIVAGRGVKQVGQAVSGERGKLVTMCSIISASGIPVPPVFVFPRAKMVDTLMNGAPSGSLGYPNSPESGWMTSKIFLKVLNHLQVFTRCSKDDPILLLMDNHDSHCSLEAILFAKNNGIILLTFPPHCSHRLQPLDVGVLGPFKGKFKIASNDWLLNHPGRTISIHNIAEIVGTAYAASFTINNIKQGFKKPGIWPVNRNAFSDEDFESSFVTDRPPPLASIPLPQENNVTARASTNASPVQPSTSNEFSSCLTGPSTSTVASTSHITPEMVRPYPKVTEERKKIKTGKKQGSTKILTDTPVKDEIERAYIDRIVKKVLKQIPKKNKLSTSSKIGQKKKNSDDLENIILSTIMEMRPNDENVENIEKEKTIKRKTVHTPDKINKEIEVVKQVKRIKKKVFQSSSSSSSSESEGDEISLHDSSDSDENGIVNEIREYEIENVSKNDFVLVKFPTKKTVVHYVAQVEENQFSELFVKFLRNKSDFTFCFPDIEDSANVMLTDVVLKLPQPATTGETLRSTQIFKFPTVDFNSYNMR